MVSLMPHTQVRWCGRAFVRFSIWRVDLYRCTVPKLRTRTVRRARHTKFTRWLNTRPVRKPRGPSAIGDTRPSKRDSAVKPSQSSGRKPSRLRRLHWGLNVPNAREEDAKLWRDAELSFSEKPRAPPRIHLVVELLTRTCSQSRKSIGCGVSPCSSMLLS